MASEARREAVPGGRRLLQKPSWAPGGPSRGRLGRQEARPEAVLGSRIAVQRPSWTPGGSSAGRLGRQEARMQVLLQFCCKMQVLRRLQAGQQLQSYHGANAPLDNFYMDIEPSGRTVSWRSPEK